MKYLIVRKKVHTSGVIDMTVHAPDIARAAVPGQFLHILTGEGDKVLRRPISICDAGNDKLRFLFEVRGEGTKALSQKTEGEMLDILGPLGNGFEILDSPAVLIGGGIGIYPLFMLAKRLNSPEIYLGFRDKKALTLLDEFSTLGKVKVTTDDGSYGEKGRITDIISVDNTKAIYACGPRPMLKAVKEMAAKAGARAQLSLEQRMGCGIGACLVCVCKIKGGYQRVCTAGPVFRADEVDFDEDKC